MLYLIAERKRSSIHTLAQPHHICPFTSRVVRLKRNASARSVSVLSTSSSILSPRSSTFSMFSIVPQGAHLPTLVSSVSAFVGVKGNGLARGE
jgi:hypothetical protein